jgi:hypothetical protein
MKIIQGKCKDPKADHLYIIFRRGQAGYSVGIVIRGGDANWQSREIVAYVELHIQMTEAEARSFLRSGRFPLEFDEEAA